MEYEPELRKPDRYKISSYRAYNSKLLDRYDSWFWLWVFKVVRWDETIVSALKPEIESLRILDVGCATGRLLLALAEAGARHLAGLDLAPKIVERARAKLREHGFEADLKHADAEDRIPWPDGAFDVALLTGVLHHFYRPDDALQEIRRVVRENGRLIVIDPCFPAPLRQIVNLYLRFVPHDGDCRFYSPEAIARMLERNGWTDVICRRIVLHSLMVTGSGR
jgi:ubiquinone/menaquinone biosynthesis C-methylase UbiE